MNNPNTTKEKTLEDRLVYLARLFTQGGMSNKENYEVLKDFQDQVISETRQEVLKQVEEMIPKKQEPRYPVFDQDDEQIYGWNDCRAELINNLSQLK